LSEFWRLLRLNPNVRRTWLGQVVSEIGDHFNSIAVLSLTLELTGSGLAVSAVIISRMLPYLVAGPVAGVMLDRADRKRVMVASDLARMAIALMFVLIPLWQQQWMLYGFSALLMFSSPFFTSGRSAILPSITSTREELHTANSLVQTTAWLTLAIGTMAGGISTAIVGYSWAFVLNAASFAFSAWAIGRLQSPSGHFRAMVKGDVRPPFQAEFKDGLRYMGRTPLVLAIGLGFVGWASGGGAAQMLFTMFGEVVFQRGPAGIGMIWSAAGVGLVAGGFLGHGLGRRLTYEQYKRAVAFMHAIHGGTYVLFSLAPNIWLAMAIIAISRVAMGTNNVVNRTMLLTHVPDAYRGRVFTTVDTLMNVTMTLSLGAAGIATQHLGVREVGVAAGLMSASTALFWAAADWHGKLPEPRLQPMEEVKIEKPPTQV
jgi:MFS family permease